MVDNKIMLMMLMMSLHKKSITNYQLNNDEIK